MEKKLPLIPLFEQFVQENFKGRRLKPDGYRIKKGTAYNYANTLKLLQEFTNQTGFDLRIRILLKNSPAILLAERNYWKKFYRKFCQFLYQKKGCFDNYVGSIMKHIRTFMGFLNKERSLAIGDYHKLLYVRKEEIEIMVLQTSQLQFLINDHDFHRSLPSHLQRTKDIFVFGCSVALRFSDLSNVLKREIFYVNNQCYLHVKSQKTQRISRIKLPAYAVTIAEKYNRRKSMSSKLFPIVCLRQFNKNIRTIAERAGWTHPLGKTRSQNGRSFEIYMNSSPKKTYRFCDLISSHLMRRTAITSMLMAGVPETVVRQISGHSNNSTAFYRYVSFSQSYLDQQINHLHKLFEPDLSSN